MSSNTANPNFAIEKLLRPDAFPHEVTELRLLETHISWVILTGPFAYKIKKPVKFDFIDYSSLDLRKRFCDEELRLNRRFAPELYLDVVPIIPTDNGFVVGKSASDSADEGDGKSIEYAVKMREFPQDAILAARLNHPEVTPAAVDLFGKYIAEFHDSIELANPTIDCVRVERIGKDAVDNFSAMRDAMRNDIRANTLNQLENWTTEQFRTKEATFQRRLNTGFVRRCHGDMHLKNIVQLGGRLAAFDGIEFNEEFQWIDVLSEIAFPVMDFIARGCPGVGWRMLNSYLETTGDFGDLGVLRFYFVYRAMVRAKVTWLNPGNHTRAIREKFSVDPSHIDELAGPWDKYLKAATYFASEIRPTLAITNGFSGSGKSTAAIQLIEQQGGIRIRSDIERRRLANRIKTQDKYSPQMTDWVYLHLLELARSILRAGFPVVIDATFLKQARRSLFESLASEQNVEFRIINCDVPFDELCERVSNRIHDPSEATIDILKMQMEAYDPLTTDELQYVIKAGR